jgi:hypothetical protein
MSLCFSCCSQHPATSSDAGTNAMRDSPVGVTPGCRRSKSRGVCQTAPCSCEHGLAHGPVTAGACCPLRPP